MCPHFVNSYGGFKLQGKTAEDALIIIDNAMAIEEAGAIGMEVKQSRLKLVRLRKMLSMFLGFRLAPEELVAGNY